jgi:hypothetical protein
MSLGVPHRGPFFARWLRLGLLLGGLLAALCLSGCADLRQYQAGSTQADAMLAAPPAGLPLRVSLDAVPFFAQEEAQCGPAALATVLVNQGWPVTPIDLLSQVFTPAREGAFQVEMLAAARRQGALAVRVAPQLDALLREVAAGHPPLVLLNPALAAWPRWHYAVVVAFDLQDGTVTLRSGRTRDDVWPLSTFDFAWARSRRWGFVVTAPDQPSPIAGRDQLTEAVVAFARVQPPPLARSAYQAALSRWPAQPILEMGLAQTWADQRQWAEAVAALQAAVAHGGGAAALNNLAIVSWQAGQVDQAREAAQAALTRAREHEPRWLSVVQDTWAQVQGPSPVTP